MPIAEPERSPTGPLFHAEGLSKRYGPNAVLDDVGFTVGRNKVVSFIGENGAGKSTLLNVLSGIVPADRGRMWLNSTPFRPGDYGTASKLGVTRVFQEQALVLNVPVYENFALGHERRFDRFGQFVDKAAMIAAAERIVEEAGIDVDVRRRTGSYDFSKRQSIEIARACLVPTRLLGIENPLILLDEPTSALDRQDETTFFRLVARMKTRGSLIFVSHRLSEVLSLSDEIHVLKDGRLVASLDVAEADEATLHGLMVGRERVTDYYQEGRQHRVAANTPVVLSLRGIGRPGEYADVSIDVRAGEVVGIGGLLNSARAHWGGAQRASTIRRQARSRSVASRPAGLTLLPSSASGLAMYRPSGWLRA